MTVTQKLADLLPSLIPTAEIKVKSEEHTFRASTQTDGTKFVKTFYTLDKSPATDVQTIKGEVDGREYTFTQERDYSVNTQVNANGAEETIIAWDTEETTPDPQTPFYVTYTCVSLIGRYLAAHDDQFAAVDSKADRIIASSQVDNASGRQLDEMGKLFGELGRRRGRDDESYRPYLKSIVQSFKGRGTREGIIFAVAAGINTDNSDVSIIEDFENTEYEVQVSGWETRHTTGVIDFMAELADPSGVARRDPIHYLCQSTAVRVNAETSIVGDTRNLLDKAYLGLFGYDTQHETVLRGLGAGTLGDPEFDMT